MTGIVCCCASPDCMVNGCARYRELKRNSGYFHPINTGWICPNCGSGVAPHKDSCPHCGTFLTRKTYTVQTWNFEGENNERSESNIQTDEED